jgi:hypothetical protein
MIKTELSDSFDWVVVSALRADSVEPQARHYTKEH